MIARMLTFGLFLTSNIEKFSLIDQDLIGILHMWNAGDGLRALFSKEKRIDQEVA
jgi:hypothetical protein